MALNSDFKVKDSLYVGNSACFVTQTDTPKILSAGTELFDIFLQEGEIAASCTLSNGTAIGTFSFDGSADVTVGVDATCNTTWNSAYTTTQSNSANWNSAYTWCTTNGDNVIDTVAEGNAQGRIAVTDIGNTTSQVDVNGLGSNDTPTFSGLTSTAGLTASGLASVGGVDIINGTVDGRDVSADGTTLDTLQSLSADSTLTFSSTAQGELTVVDADGDTTCIDLGVKTDDNPTFAGATAGAVTVGVTNDNTINTTSGNLTLNSAGGQTNITDNVCVTGNITNDGTVDGRDIANDGTTLDTLRSLSGGNVFDVSGSATQGRIVETLNDGTVTNIDLTNLGTTGTPTFGGVTVNGGLSAATLSGDGSAITNIDVDAVAFPSTDKSDLASTDEFWISDGTNKKVTYSNLLTDLAGTNMGLEVDATDSLALKNYSSLTNNKVLKWDSTNGQFVDSIMTEDAGATCININGSMTITDNLSVLGTFTCLDTSVSTSSALSVVNAGTGPALYVEQTGIGQPIAEFKDTEGGTMVIGDSGDVGIGICGTDPGEKLTVSGNISANGTLKIDDNATFGGSVFLCGVTAGTDNSVVVQTSDGSLATDEIDGKVWGGALVEYCSSTTNSVPKFNGPSGTIADSSITDSGSLVTIGNDTKIGDGNSFSTYASNGTNFTSEATFSETVHTSGTNVPTFTKTNLKQVKYEITLVNGVNVTSFEVNAVYNGTAPCGTTYAIVDAQAASQLADIEISSAGSTIDLDITSASNSTTAVIKGTALY